MTIAQTTGGSDLYQTGKGPVGFGQGYNATPVIAVIPGVDAGFDADVQVRAWKTTMGSTWEAAYAAWLNHSSDANYVLGLSDVQTLTLANSTLSSIYQPRLGAAPDSTYSTFSSSPGITSFGVVPEPGVMTLAGLGLVGAWYLRRRK